VFAPNLLLSVTIESSAGQPEYSELHFHPGGQGFWIARMLQHLGERPLIVAPLGGEAGRVLRGLIPAWNVKLSAVGIEAESPSYVHDRRSGERTEIACSRPPSLDRHELDDLFGHLLDRASAAGMCIVPGRTPGDSLTPEFYQRLSANLAATRVEAIGDLHGEELSAFLEGGPLHTLKVSDTDLVEDGTLSPEASVEERLGVASRFVGLGAARVVVSAAIGSPTVACFGSQRLLATHPVLEAVDHRGSGDAMTAGLAAGALHRLDPAEALRLACGAGAANVIRRGLANADGRLVRSLAKKVEIRELVGNPR
jgi:1-phosphofructokinase